MPTFETPRPITATVQVAGARVRVTASDRTDTVVQVDPVDPTKSSHVKVADRTAVDFVDGRLSVKTTVSGDKGGSVAIAIDLPTGSGLVTYTSNSEVDAEGSLGACELHLATGRIHLGEITALQADIAGGEVAIDRIAGPATIEGSVVALRIGEVTEAVELSTSGGQTWIGHAATDVALSSANGGFDIDRADGSVAAETANGAIRIGRLTRGQARLSNSSGNIEVGITEGSTVSVDADSTRGTVRDAISAQDGHEPTDPTVTVHARTRHGDVVIRRAAS